MVQGKPDWNLLLNLHQSIRAEQSLRAQAYAAALLSEQIDQVAAHALTGTANTGQEVDSLRAQVEELKRENREQTEKRADSARSAARQVSLRGKVFKIRKQFEALSEPCAGDQQAAIAFCKKSLRAMPSPAMFHQIVDKEYCHETLALIDRRLTHLQRLRQAHILQAFRDVVACLQSSQDAPAAVLSHLLEAERTAPSESIFDDQHILAEYGDVLKSLRNTEAAIRKVVPVEQAATIDSLYSSMDDFLTRSSSLRGKSRSSEGFYAEMMAASRLTKQILSAWNGCGAEVKESFRWAAVVKSWEAEVFRPYLSEVCGLKCMILVAKAESEPTEDVKALLYQAGLALGLNRSEIEQLREETRSVQLSDFTGDRGGAIRLIEELVSIAITDGGFGLKENDLIRRIGAFLRVSEGDMQSACSVGKRRYLDRQIPRLLRDSAARVGGKSIVEASWYVAQNSTIEGPLALRDYELQQAFSHRSGTGMDAILVWRPGIDHWVLVAEATTLATRAVAQSGASSKAGWNRDQHDTLAVLVALGERPAEAERWLERARVLYPETQGLDQWLQAAYRAGGQSR